MGPGIATAGPPAGAAVTGTQYLQSLGNPFVDTRLIDKPGKFFGKKSDFSSWSFTIRGHLGLIGLFTEDGAEHDRVERWADCAFNAHSS